MAENRNGNWLLRSEGESTELVSRATSFHAATRFFPRDDRLAIEKIYRFCRAVDDLADDPSLCDSDVFAKLDQIAAWLRSFVREQSVEPDPIEDLRQLIVYRSLDVRPLLCLVKGVRSDRLVRERATGDDLLLYCFQVAGLVGMIMAQLLGTREREAQAYAATLGVAMQLTNIIRDIGEDLEREIFYLPTAELARFGYSRRRLERRIVDADLVHLLRWQIARARHYYAVGLAGLSWLSPSARFPIGLAARLYAGILEEVEANDYDVFNRRARTSLPRKLQLTVATAAGLQWSGRLEVSGWPSGGDILAQVSEIIRGELVEPKGVVLEERPREGASL